MAISPEPSTSPPLEAYGGPIVTDGEFGEEEWSGAAQVGFTAYRPGGSGARPTGGRLYLRNDDLRLNLAVTIADPLPDPKDVVTLVLRKGESQFVIKSAAGGGASGAQGAWSKVETRNPAQIYEFAKPLSELGATVGDIVEFRLEITPGGSAAPTIYPGQGSFGGFRITGPPLGNQPPVAVASADPGVGFARMTSIAFSSLGSSDPDGTIVSYAWDFGDGITSALPNPSHTYETPGTYNVSLTVTDNDGATGVAGAQVTIHPSVRVTVVPAAGEGRCDVTVIARNADPSKDDFHVQRAGALTCDVYFAVSPDGAGDPNILAQGERYVLSIRNTIIGVKSEFTIWPPATNVVAADNDLPARLSAVCVETGGACTSEILTPTTYGIARGAATALDAANRDLSIQFRLVGRTIPCDLGGGTPNFLFVTLPLDENLYPTPDFPPGLGLYVAEVLEGEPCLLKNIPDGEGAVVEGRDDDGTTYRGYIPPTNSSAPVVVEADPNFFHKTLEIDDFDDNASGKDDITLLRFGLANVGTPSAPQRGTTFILKLTNRQVQEKGQSHYLFDFRSIQGTSGPTAYSFRVQCSRQEGRCNVSQVSPSRAASRILGVWGTAHPNGQGSVEVHSNFAGATSAMFNLRAGVSNGFDFWPNSGFHTWVRSDVAGGTFKVAF
jgi:PKD repeat protein